MTYAEKVAALRALLEESVRACVGDGNAVALQLSGGLDSAVIQAIAGLDRLYCCTWPEFDNITAATKAARGKPVREVTFTRDEMIEVALPEVARLTQGRGTWSQCCQWFLARAMAADGVRVELNGEGSDELFSGYARYRILYWLDRMFADPHLAEYGGIIEHVICRRPRPALVGRMLSRVAGVSVDDVLNVPSGAMSDQVGYYDETHGLVELVGHEATIAQAHGIEHRWPFMADSVVAFAHTLTEADKINERESKAILRDVARSLGVHSDIADEVTKRGLVVPPSWAPAGAAKWSRGWFDALMAAEWQRQQNKAA